MSSLKYIPRNVVVLLGLSLTLVGCSTADRTDNRTDSRIANASPSPTSEATPTKPNQTDTTIQSEISPNDWKKLYDGALSVEYAHPQNWSIRPATNRQAESAVYSFDPAQTPDTGGIPGDQIKIAITYFGPDSDRNLTFDPTSIEHQTRRSVDNYAALVREISGGAGSSKTVEVDIGKDTMYLISAYPLDSQLMDTFDKFLDYLDLDKQPPVTIQQPALGTTISSPLTITGRALGTWFGEGQLTLALRGADNTKINQVIVMAEGEWMTEEPVKFSTDITYTNPDANFGFIAIQKANPSGLIANASTFTWPVGFINR